MKVHGQLRRIYGKKQMRFMIASVVGKGRTLHARGKVVVWFFKTQLWVKARSFWYRISRKKHGFRPICDHLCSTMETSCSTQLCSWSMPHGVGGCSYQLCCTNSSAMIVCLWKFVTRHHYEFMSCKYLRKPQMWAVTNVTKPRLLRAWDCRNFRDSHSEYREKRDTLRMCGRSIWRDSALHKVHTDRKTPLQ